MDRRQLLRSLPAAAVLTGCAAASTTPVAKSSRTFVLVHGAWHGGWCWTRVAEGLRAQGHAVYTPTQTGLGERRHLLTPEMTLDTFVADIVNVFEAEELTDVVLVGHSFGGLSITGVADRIPQHVRHLVYLDSIILQPGQSLFGKLPADAIAKRRKAAAEAGHVIAAPAPKYLGVPDGPDADWVRRRMTPHPFGTWDSPLKLDHPVGNGRPCTYVACTKPQLASVKAYAEWARAQPRWDVRGLRTGHDAMITAPAEVIALLSAVAG